MFEMQLGDSGNATSEPPSAEPSAGATPISEEAGAIAAPETPIQPIADGEATAAAAAPEAPAQPSEDPNFEELLREAEADPRTPKWYRDGLKKAQGYVGTLKEQAQQAEAAANELRSQYEGNNIPTTDPAELERMRAAEERLFNIQSFSTKPEDIDAFLKETNPRVYNDYRNHLVLSALEQPDGTPDIDNLQFIVDRFSGVEGKVKAKDVLAIVEGIAAGQIDPTELHGFVSPEEYEAHKAKVAKEQELEERAKAIESSAKYQEQQIREREIQMVVGGMKQQIDQQIQGLMDKFKLAPVQGEPKATQDFKARTNERIAALVNSASSQIREFTEIRQAFEILSQPGKTPMQAEQAVADVQAFVNSQQFKTYSGRGISELMKQIEKVVSEEAYFHKLVSKAIGLENAKPQEARPVIGSPNQTANLPALTEADLAKMTAAERRDYKDQMLSAQIRALRYGGQRTGQ